jgi:uncharacterized membrane protein (TIGR02234 family)
VRRNVAFAAALVLDLLGAGGALLISSRAWQTVTTPRPSPLRADVLGLSGRTIDAASTALGLVALAGVVAVLATRGIGRRVVGAVLALAGVGLVWRALVSVHAVSAARARTLVTDHHPTVSADAVVPRVAVHSVWPVLSLFCGVLVAVAGALIVWRGHRWQVMSARYEAQPDREAEQARAAASLWTALDRGEDPTGRS